MDRIERFMAASGDFDAYTAARDAFDAALEAEPVVQSRDHLVLLDAMGLKAS